MPFEPGNNFGKGIGFTKKPESELSQNPAAVRIRERRKAEAAIEEKLESQINSEDFEAQEAFLKECSKAVDVLLEADAFLLWTLHPMHAKALAIPLPHHINDSNIDDANAHIEAFAVEYEQNPWRGKVRDPWALMLRLELLNGITLPYPVCDCKGPHAPTCPFPEARVWFRISPGYRDLYKQFCKRVGKPILTEFVKPTTIPVVPSKNDDEVKSRFLARGLALDKGFTFIPKNEGLLGLLFIGGRAYVDWKLMTEKDEQALAKAVSYKYQKFCGIEPDISEMFCGSPVEPPAPVAPPPTVEAATYETSPPEPRATLPSELHDALTKCWAALENRSGGFDSHQRQSLFHTRPATDPLPR